MIIIFNAIFLLPVFPACASDQPEQITLIKHQMIITNPIDVDIQEDDEFLMCSWHIHTEENSRIELFLLSLNLSERCDCCFNY